MAKSSVWIDGVQAGRTLKEIKKDVALLNREINNLPIGSEKYNKKLQELSKSKSLLDQHRGQVNQIANSYGPAKSQMMGMLKQFAPLAIGIAAVGSVMGGASKAIGSWVDNNIRLERSLDTLQSLTGASTEDVKFYREEAIQMGKDTTQSATQVVDAMKMIGSQKPELLKNRDGLASMTEQVIVLAEAAEIDLQTAALATTATLNQFRMGAESGGRAINAFAAGSKEGAAGIADIGQTMDKAGATMHDYNVSMEEGVGLTETLAELNIKGAEAGTQLKNVLTKMQTVKALPREALDQLKAFGVDLNVVADETLPFQQRLKEMSKISGDATAIVKVFGIENKNAASAILQNTDTVEKYTAAVTGTNTAYEQQAINNDNLEGDLKSLGSAWEGLTLTVGGVSEAFRPLVQAGTDVLNWISDTVVAFQEWDTTKMETSFLKFVSILPGVSGEFERLIDQQIRINEISSQVTEAVKQEAHDYTVLTSAVSENNDALQSGTLTAEEHADIEAQNAEIIDLLNEKYPELTKNLDLQTASRQELSKLQQEINANLLEEAINAAKAAEEQRILSSIIEATLRQAQIRAEFKKAESEGGPWNLLKQGDLAKEMGELSQTLDNEKKNLQDLNKTMNEVKTTVGGLNIDWAGDWTTSTDMAADAMKELEAAEKKLAKTTDKEARLALEAQIKTFKSISSTAKTSKKDLVAAALALRNATEVAGEASAQEAEEKAQRIEAASKEAVNRVKQLREELKQLIEVIEQRQAEFDYTKQLDAFKDEQQKEIFELEHTLGQKYQKEIESAEKLAKQKGDIGAKAAEELAVLEKLKSEELEYEKTKIASKFAEQRAKEAELLSNEKYDREKNANLQLLAQQESLAAAKVELEVKYAELGIDATRNLSLSAQQQAFADLVDALNKRADYEKKVNTEKLMDEYDSGVIGKKEYNLRLADLERDHMQQISDISDEANEKMAQSTQERVEAVIEVVSQILSVIGDLENAEFEKRIDAIDKEEKAQIKSIEKKQKRGELSDEEAADAKDKIQTEYEAKRAKAEQQHAEKQKELAIFEALIQTALAVVKAAPNPITMALAAAIGAIQIGIIASKPVPQAKDGGWMTVTGAQDGKQYDAKYMGRMQGGYTPAHPSLALISEEGPEYYVPNGLLRNPTAMNHVRALEAIRTNQFADGGFTSPVGSAAGGSDELTMVLRDVIRTNMALRQAIMNIGVKIGDGELEAMDERLTELYSYKNAS